MLQWSFWMRSFQRNKATSSRKLGGPTQTDSQQPAKPIRFGPPKTILSNSCVFPCTGNVQSFRLVHVRFKHSFAWQGGTNQPRQTYPQQKKHGPQKYWGLFPKSSFFYLDPPKLGSSTPNQGSKPPNAQRVRRRRQVQLEVVY